MQELPITSPIMDPKHRENSEAGFPFPTMSQEFQEFLEALPCDTTAGPPLYLYKGMWFVPRALEGALAVQKEFQAQMNDIILVTAPKSGTTWLKALVFSIIYRTKHSVSDPNHPILTNNPHALVPYMHPVNTEENFSFTSYHTSPRLFSSHLSYSMLPESSKLSKSRIIYLTRDPKDIFVSIWHFAKRIMPLHTPPLKEAFDSFCSGAVMFGPCWEHALEFWKLSLESPKEVLFLKYEDLKEDITSEMRKLANYLGVPFSIKEEKDGVLEALIRLCEFDNMSNLDVNKTGKPVIGPWLKNEYFFRKGEVGDWKNVLTASMGEQLDQVVEQKLYGSGLTFI